MVPKFRAWCGNKMWRVMCIEYPDDHTQFYAALSLDGRENLIATLNIEHNPQNLPVATIMAGTGRRGKAGIEIFESDIVRWKPEWIRGEPAVGIVAWDVKSCGFTIEQRTFPRGQSKMWDEESGIPKYDWNELEVVGNLYENPECAGG